MPPKYIIYVILLSVFPSGLHAADSPPDKNILRDATLAYAWMSKGKMYTIDMPAVDGGTTLWFYKRADSETVALNASLSNISEMFSAEINKSELREFVERQLPQLLVAFFSSGKSRLLDAWYIDICKKSGRRIDSSIIASCLERELPVFEKNTWNVVFMALTRNGAIERWKLRGTISSFQISNIEIQQIAGSGTLEQLDEIGKP